VRKVQAFAPYRRATLATYKDSVLTIFKAASQLKVDTLLKGLSFQDLCAYCRWLGACGFLVDSQLLEAATEQLTKILQADPSASDLDAAASLALAACEAGQEAEIGAKVLDGLSSSGMAAEKVSGSSAAALALAAAVSHRADSALFHALLLRCSTCEADLDPLALGDLRLASALAPGLAGNFFKLLCSDVLLDDPRGHLSATEGTFAESFTTFESEVSKTLTAAEIPHSRGLFVEGGFFPLVNNQHRWLFCPEDVAGGAVYINQPDQRRGWQRWKCQAAAKAGWSIFCVSHAHWQTLIGMESRIAHIREIRNGAPTFPAESAAG